MIATMPIGTTLATIFQGLALCIAFTTAALAADLTGRWSLELDPDFDGNQASLPCDLTQEGRQLTLECDAAPVPFAGTVDDRVVTFVVMTGQDNLLPAKFVGTLDANNAIAVGTWRLEDTTGNRIGRFELRRTQTP